jgi:hypothetical protein
VIGPALQTLNRAKKHLTTRLLVQFGDGAAVPVAERKAKIDQELRNVDATLSSIDRENPNEDAESKAERRKPFLALQSKLKGDSAMLGKAVENFAREAPYG